MRRELAIQRSQGNSILGGETASAKALKIPGVLRKQQGQCVYKQSEQGVGKALWGK